MKNNIIVFSFVFVSALFFHLSSPDQVRAANTATMKAYGLEILLMPTTFYDDEDLVWRYIEYSTYDGVASNILYDSQSKITSRELKQVGSKYYTDIMIRRTTSQTFDVVGYSSLALSTADTDNNGIPDIFEPSRAVNQNVSWYYHTYWYGGDEQGTLTGQITRNANSTQGTYSLGPGYIVGDYYIGHLSGSIAYSHETGVASYTLQGGTLYNETVQEEVGQGAFTIIDQDTIQVPEMTVRNTSGVARTIPAHTFKRYGKTYRTTIKIADGFPLTSWPDYQNWIFVITDNNDSDGDGIPDLSDPPPPDPPRADFAVNVNTGVAPLAVSFTEQCTESPTDWSWDFGDSGGSTARNPTHLYTVPGKYAVRLTCANEGGSDTISKDHIHVARAGADLNSDGRVDLGDLILAQQVVIGKKPGTMTAGQSGINEDDTIGLAEALYILRYLSGAGGY